MHMEWNELRNSVQDTLIILEHRSTETSNKRKHCVGLQPRVHLFDITFQNVAQNRNNE